MLPLHHVTSRKLVGWGLLFGVWTVIGVAEAVETYFKAAYRSAPMGELHALVFGLAISYLWAFLTIGAIQYVGRFPLTRGKWWYRLPMALGFAVVLALAKLALDYPVIELFYCPRPGLLPFTAFYQVAFMGFFKSYVLTAIGILAILYVWNAIRAYRERELRTWQLEARLAQAQLELLRMQLHPHFLFNTLNTISTLIHGDPEAADRVLSRLGDLLRQLLDTAGEKVITLRQEIDFIQAYLDIERTRFGSRIRTDVQVPESLAHVLVPPCILQPIVENAIHHGIARSDRSGRLEVRARRQGERIRLEVWNDGPSLRRSEANGNHKSIGLANTRARLTQLHGANASFEIQNDAEGVLAWMEFPLVEAPHSHFDERCATANKDVPPALVSVRGVPQT